MTPEMLEMFSGLLVGIVLPWVVEYLNKIWELDGPKALSLVGILSFVVTGVIMFISGNFTFTNFTMADFLPVVLSVFGSSQVIFQAFKKALGWEK